MVDRPAPGDERAPRLLIPDTTPLALLGSIELLDWLFVPGCPVWVTDMVLEEATRDPGPGKDRRRHVRELIADWFQRNQHRIEVLATPEGEAYQRAMDLWRLAGNPPALEPDRSDLGERSVLGTIRSARTILARNETILAIVDDRDARAALRAVHADIDLMGTRTFISWLALDFGVAEAETAWPAIQIAFGGRADPGEEDDPVYIRRRAG
jgi:hypothetical protein